MSEIGKNYCNLYVCEYKVPLDNDTTGTVAAYAPISAPIHVGDEVILASGINAKVVVELFVDKNSDVCKFVNLLIHGKPIRIVEKIYHEKINYHDEQEGD